MFGLGQGALEVLVPVSDEEQITIHRAEPGFWVGDSGVLARATQVMSVVAVTPSRVFCIRASSVWRLLSERPEFWRCFYELAHLNGSLRWRRLPRSCVLSRGKAGAHTPSASRCEGRNKGHSNGVGEPARRDPVVTSARASPPHGRSQSEDRIRRHRDRRQDVVGEDRCPRLGINYRRSRREWPVLVLSADPRRASDVCIRPETDPNLSRLDGKDSRRRATTASSLRSNAKCALDGGDIAERSCDHPDNRQAPPSPVMVTPRADQRA